MTCEYTQLKMFLYTEGQIELMCMHAQGVGVVVIIAHMQTLLKFSFLCLLCQFVLCSPSPVQRHGAKKYCSARCMPLNKYHDIANC